MELPDARIARFCLAAAALLTASCASAQTPAHDPIAGLGWLAGCWERRTGEILIEERWMPPHDGSP